ncbi:hypothetical protein GCM10023177_75230 [Streptomyces violaceoruber]
MCGPVKGETPCTGTMVPPGGTAHIADRADPPDSGTMRVFRGPRRARERRAARIPGAVRMPTAARAQLGALPGLAAVKSEAKRS